MKQLHFASHVFDVDIEATKAYYQSNILCDCDCCKRFYAEAKNRYPELNEYLRGFGVDISHPDEAMSYETEDSIEYISVDYTVCGKIAPDAEYETHLANDGLDIKINNGFVSPNEQTGEYFTISVEGIRLSRTNATVVDYITVPDTAIRAVNRGRQLNEASSIVYCGNDDELHLIDLEACTINFKAEHENASDNCIGEKNIKQGYLLLYTSGIKTKIAFQKGYVSNLFHYHLLTGTKTSRFHALCNLIDETKFTTFDIT